MRGFRNFPELLGRRSTAIILSMLFAGVALFNSGCSGLVNASNGGGGTPLTISNVAVVNVTATSVGIDWQTNTPANSQVEYGTTTNYGSTTAIDSTMVASHQLTVSSLKPGTAYHCRVHSTDAKNSSAVSGDLACSTSPDTTPPAVSITFPIANATLSGTVILTATATDNLGVASVQFKVDNANIGTAISSAPYSYTLNTATLSDGNHILTAMATDTSGNTATSTGIAVKVNNTTSAPSITSLNPASGLVGASVMITGSNFGATQGTGTVTFNGTTATPTSWSSTSIVAPVPAGATTGNVVVTVGGIASNGVNFTVTVPGPSITSLNPASGLVGASVTIIGSNFGATRGASTVTFSGTTATPTSWSATSIVVPVPAGATTGTVVVTVGGVASNGMSFTVTIPAPNITSVSPTSGVVGTPVTVIGANFGATQGTSTVKFNGISATPTNWSATSIVVPVPAGATTGNVVVTVGGVASNGVNFTVTAPGPSITSLNPVSGLAGAPVTISGVNFGATQATSTVTFNGTTATPTSWSATSVIAPVPVGATTGNVVVTVGGAASNGVNFTVTVPAPSITNLNPTSGVAGTSVTIAGANFGAVQGASTVKFNGIAAAPTSWSGTSIVVPVPAGATTGNVVLTVGGVASNGVNFTVTVPGPSIASLNPVSGMVGTPVTIMGANFGATQGTSTVKFNGIAATPTSWSATSISVPAPAGATTGNVVVTVSGIVSNGVNFTVTVPAPNITSLNPVSGLVGTPVTITGANFGTTQGSNTVKFNGIAATPTSWSATSIVVPVPAGATTGTVVVTVSGVTSNGVSFTVTVPGPSITNLNPTSGAVGTSVTIMGANFGATQGTSAVTFNGTAATPTSWSATSIVVPVPTAATTGTVVVTVGGIASNGMNFTVTVPGPSITSLNPTSGVVGASVTVMGTNFGATQGASTVTFNGTTATPTSWSATSIVVPVPTGATTGTVVVTVGGIASNGVSFTVSTGSGSSMGPLKQSTVNTRYFVTPGGNAVFLSGSHTWDDFQDTDTSGSTPAAFDFNAYVTFLKQNQHNVTILWHKDLPEYCGWNVSGSTWTMTPWPWLRPGPGVATDSNPKFDLTQFNQAYFDRLRTRVQQLQQSGIYAIVQLFDVNQLTYTRCTDGYAFSGPNNINGVSDGYTSGTSGFASASMTTNNAISNYQDAYVKKVVDTVNDLPNVLFEVAEEQPIESMTWWAPHMLGLVQAYEGGGMFEGTTYTAKPFQHPVGIGSLNFFDQNDPALYASIASWIAPTLAASSFPSNVPVNNQGKVVINDSDHSLGYAAFTNSDGSIKNQNLRGYIWENITNGAAGLIFMDPYAIYWQGSPMRNTCLSPVHQICTGGVDTKYDPFRQAMGFAQAYVNAKMDLQKATPQGSLSSTGFCLADNAPTGAEYLVYAPNGGAFTVNLSATARTLNVEWFNPATGATTSAAAITGGSTKSFTAPFGGDAVLYIVDAAGHN